MAISLHVPMFTARLGEGVSDTVHYTRNTEKQGLPTLARFASSSKGVSDILGLASKAARFGSLLYPDSNSYAHVGAVTGNARTVMAIPAVIGSVNRCVESFKNKDFFEGTGNALEVGSNLSFASSALVTDRVLASNLSGVGSTIKTVKDGMDLGKNVDKLVHLNNLKNAANATTCSKEVKDGINSQFTATALKVGRFALALFAGVLTVLTFVFKIALAKELLIAGLVASVGSIIFSIASEMVTESSEIVPVSGSLRNCEVIESSPGNFDAFPRATLATSNRA